MKTPRTASWFHKIINKILGRSDITFGGSTYMRRWRILHTKWFGVRIHNILRSDYDRELHDHPFTFITFILRGGYFEHTIDGRRVWYGPGTILVRSGEVLHKLDLKKASAPLSIVDSDYKGPVINAFKEVEIPAWTFVIRGPAYRRWGFLDLQGGQWIDAADFDRHKEARRNRGEIVPPNATEVR
jgi:hypothetical protein